LLRGGRESLKVLKVELIIKIMQAITSEEKNENKITSAAVRRSARPPLDPLVHQIILRNLLKHRTECISYNTCINTYEK